MNIHTPLVTPAQLLSKLQEQFAQHADPHRAVQQQRYMKSTMPYWGVKKPIIDKICAHIFSSARPVDSAAYCATIEYIFTHAQKREEWYAAVIYARKFSDYITPAHVCVYIALILQGQWWDIVDEVAVHLVGKALRESPQMPDQVRSWITHENIWIQRTALLVQLTYKKQTDFVLLTELIMHVAHKKEFFIRKAIGWVLREYSKTNPVAVHAYITAHTHLLSPLSVREGLRRIVITPQNMQ